MQKRVLLLLAPLVLLGISLFSLDGLLVAAVVPDWQTKVDPWILQQTDAGEQSEFLVFLTTQADLAGAANFPSKAERGAYVYEQLTRTAAQSQPALLSQLSQMGVEYEPFWIANMVWVRGDAAAVRSLSQRDDVAHLFANPAVKMAEPLPAGGPSPLSPEVVEWNIQKVNAPDLWEMGITGENVVIAGQDTGYDWDHPALIGQYRGWSGQSANHNYNWHDAIHSGGGSCGPNSPVPCDDNGHGTHTMGTMVGDDRQGNQVGMAPGAQWIGCRNMNQGVGTPATYSECFQWFMAPTDLQNENPDSAKAPHVINNSWSCPPSEGCTDPLVLQTVVENVRAAGIVVVVSAGNTGYLGCGSITTPPAIYDASFTVAATDRGDNVASFSSRGPVTVDGSNRLKPDISAPGSSIRSSTLGGGYGLNSGTSMASPHVAGLVALLLAADPSLAGQVDLLEQLIFESAVPRTTDQTCGGVLGTSIPNHTYGYGRIDALAAYEALSHTLSLTKSASTLTTMTGEYLTYTLSVLNRHPFWPTSNVVLTDVIPGGTSLVTATLPFAVEGGMVQWFTPTLAPGASWQVELAVQVNVTDTGLITNSQYGASSDEVAVVRGSPLSMPVLYPFELSLYKEASAAWVGPGERLTYTISLTNEHPLSLTHNVVLTDLLPAGTTFVTATEPFTLQNNVVQWQIPLLGAGETMERQLVVLLAEDAPATITNRWYGIDSDESEVLQGKPLTTAVGLSYSLTVDKVAHSRVTGTSGMVVYTVTVVNDGLLPLHNVVLTDVVPTGTQLVSATMPYSHTGEVVRWEQPELASGSVWTTTLIVEVMSSAPAVIGNVLYGVLSQEVQTVHGEPVLTPRTVPWHRVYLPVIGR